MDASCILVVLSLVALAAWRFPALLCRLGVHARPRYSGARGWVCRRCPFINGRTLAQPVPGEVRP